MSVQQISKEKLLSLLETCDVFSELDEFTKDSLASISSYREYNKDENSSKKWFSEFWKKEIVHKRFHFTFLTFTFFVIML